MSRADIASCPRCGQEMRGTDYIARLRAIADAAPDMLAALEAIDSCREVRWPLDLEAKARAAIKKARGESLS
jgi:hypothetical protein